MGEGNVKAKNHGRSQKITKIKKKEGKVEKG